MSVFVFLHCAIICQLSEYCNIWIHLPLLSKSSMKIKYWRKIQVYKRAIQYWVQLVTIHHCFILNLEAVGWNKNLHILTLSLHIGWGGAPAPWFHQSSPIITLLSPSPLGGYAEAVTSPGCLALPSCCITTAVSSSSSDRGGQDIHRQFIYKTTLIDAATTS